VYIHAAHSYIQYGAFSFVWLSGAPGQNAHDISGLSVAVFGKRGGTRHQEDSFRNVDKHIQKHIKNKCPIADLDIRFTFGHSGQKNILGRIIIVGMPDFDAGRHRGAGDHQGRNPNSSDGVVIRGKGAPGPWSWKPAAPLVMEAREGGQGGGSHRFQRRRESVPPVVFVGQ